MSWIFWIGYLLLLILISFQVRYFEKLDKKYSFLTLTLLTVYLIGTSFFNEYLPRYEDTWSHSYLPQEIFRHKKVNIGISIYEEYPGSFLFYGLMFEFLPKYDVMKFFPPLFYIVGLLSIYLLVKNLVNEKLALFTSILYMFFNWTVEDNHISPQFLNLNVYFFLMFVLVKLLDKKQNKKEYLFIIALFTATIVFSHPLTPMFLILILGSIFILNRKLRKEVFPAFVIVLTIFLTYEVYRATTINYIIDYLKEFIQIITSEPSLNKALSRFRGLSFLSRQIILGSKIFLTVFSLIFGNLGMLLLRKKRFGTAANFFFVWAFSLIPFIIIMSQLFGGEFYERFILISSLPLAFLSAYYLEHYNFRATAILIILLVLTFPYFLGKHGNEVFESESLQKLRADCFSFKLDTDCEEKMEIIGSPLNWDIENLGETHFGISREEIIASSIYNDRDLEATFELIEKQAETKKLDRIYSTEESAVYHKF
jgi:hypothetical protein